MNKTSLAVVALAVLSVLAGTWYYRYKSGEQAEQRLELPATPIPPELSEEPVIRYPVPTQPTLEPDSQTVQQVEQEVAQAIDSPVDTAAEGTEPAQAALPPLDKSDAELHEGLGAVTEPRTFEPLFNLDNIIRRFVVTVDNLPGRKLPQRHVLNKAVQGPFMAAGEEDARFIDPENYQRYTPYIRLLESLDTEKIAALYIRYYPLFQAAYADLGYPSAYFNDRLVEVIDHLLATPQVQGRIQLVRPHVLYKFASPDLEALSAGQKVLIRMGRENAVRVKAKLRELRSALTLQEPAP